MNNRERHPRGRSRFRSTSLDDQFDGLLPDSLRHLSSTHWTPVRAAVRAASLLCTDRKTRILDVGAGVGKMCTIGAMSGEGTWVGVEHYASLVESAVDLARSLGVASRTHFLQADAFSIDWDDFDALYLYNPFELQLFSDSKTTESAKQVACVQQRLSAMPNCTRVVTLHGFGGVMPSSYELLYHEVLLGVGLDLALWIQRAPRVSVSTVS